MRSADSTRQFENSASRTLLLVLAVFFFQLAFGAGHLYSYDEVVTLATAVSILEEGDAGLGFDPAPEVKEYSKRGRDGEYYSKFGVGMSAWLIPFYWVFKQFGALLGWPHPEALADFLVSFANVPVVILIAIFFRSTLRRFGVSENAAVITTVLLVFSTSLGVYGRGLFNDALVALFTLIAFRMYFYGRPIYSGIATAIAAATRLEYAVMSAAYILFFKNRKRLLYAIPVISIFLMLFLFNAIRFGSAIDQGQVGTDQYDTFSTPIHVGLAGLFLSPGKGVLWYAPPIWLAIMGINRFRKRHPREALLLAASIIPVVIVHALWHSWMGGWSYGPRRLIAVLPLMMIPAGFAVDRLISMKHGRAAIALLAVTGFLMQLGGLTTNFMHYIMTLSRFSDYLWTISLSGAVGQLRFLAKTGQWDLWYVHLAGANKHSLVFGLALAGLWLLFTALLLRSARRVPPVARTS